MKIQRIDFNRDLTVDTTSHEEIKTENAKVDLTGQEALRLLRWALQEAMIASLLETPLRNKTEH